MGERGFNHLTRRIRLLRRPVPEARETPVPLAAVAAHPFKRLTAGRRGFRQVNETRRVGRAWGKLLLYYTLGSDPALWPARERRERELIKYDKGYYHSCFGAKAERNLSAIPDA